MVSKDKTTSLPLRGVDLIHADDSLAEGSYEVAPSISVTTTFKAPNPSEPYVDNADIDPRHPSRHIYSRYTQNVSSRVEQILSRINRGYALTYSSGLAASYAALVFFKPKRIAITAGYHGTHHTIEVYSKSGGRDIQVIGLDDEFKEGDIAWVETPLNPTGESRDIKYYADKIHAAGGKLIVDSTFGPPPLQYPFTWGADCVFHSGTKYFGGHSDLLSGVLVVQSLDEWKTLWSDRTFLGNMMGSLESWLLLRSLRTLHLRVPRQSATATALAQWLNEAANAPAGRSYDGIPPGIVQRIWHSSLQPKDQRGFDPKNQMEGGWNATFAIYLDTAEHAAMLPYTVKYFAPATSLGGVESLMEQRVRSDSGADPRLVRLSIGVEDLEDLKDDLRKAFQTLAKEKAKL